MGWRRVNWWWLALMIAALLGGVVWWCFPNLPLPDPIQRPSGFEPSSSSTDLAARELEPFVRDARQAADLLMERFASDPGALHMAGQLYYQLGDTAAAVRLWQECLQRNPNDGDARIAIGMLRFESGEFAEAEQVLMDVFLQAPGHPQASYLLASSLLNQGKLDDTAEVLRASLSIHPQSVPNLVLLGQVLLQQKQPAEAKESFLAASRLAPDYANAWFGLASACVQLGQQEEAATHRATFQQLQRQQLREEIEQTRDYDDQRATKQDLAATYAAVGRFYLERSDEAAAEHHWQLALQLDEGNHQARIDLARLYQSQHRPKQALACLLPLRDSQQAQDAGFWMWIGQLHAQLDDFQQADEAFVRVMELAPDTGLGDAARAELRIKMERASDEAVRFARQAVERQPSAEHYFLLSVACRHHGATAEARQAAEQALRLEPGHPQYRQWYLSLQVER
jgi:tetratricopeptide (TPR) repeat protein